MGSPGPEPRAPGASATPLVPVGVGAPVGAGTPRGGVAGGTPLAVWVADLSVGAAAVGPSWGWARVAAGPLGGGAAPAAPACPLRGDRRHLAVTLRTVSPAGGRGSAWNMNRTLSRAVFVARLSIHGGSTLVEQADRPPQRRILGGSRPETQASEAGSEFSLLRESQHRHLCPHSKISTLRIRRRPPPSGRAPRPSLAIGPHWSPAAATATTRHRRRRSHIGTVVTQLP